MSSKLKSTKKRHAGTMSRSSSLASMATTVSNSGRSTIYAQPMGYLDYDTLQSPRSQGTNYALPMTPRSSVPTIYAYQSEQDAFSRSQSSPELRKRKPSSKLNRAASTGGNKQSKKSSKCKTCGATKGASSIIIKRMHGSGKYLDENQTSVFLFDTVRQKYLSYHPLDTTNISLQNEPTRFSIWVMKKKSELTQGYTFMNLENRKYLSTNNVNNKLQLVFSNNEQIQYLKRFLNDDFIETMYTRSNPNLFIRIETKLPNILRYLNNREINPKKNQLYHPYQRHQKVF
jgi:hypothetical protein